MGRASRRDDVREALVSLSVEGAARLGSINGLFRSWQSPQAVAERAGVSVTTARRHLDGLVGYRGFARHRFAGGIYGYRYTEINL